MHNSFPKVYKTANYKEAYAIEKLLNLRNLSDPLQFPFLGPLGSQPCFHCQSDISLGRLSFLIHYKINILKSEKYSVASGIWIKSLSGKMSVATAAKEQAQGDLSETQRC